MNSIPPTQPTLLVRIRDAQDQEAVRQHALAALNITQQTKRHLLEAGSGEPVANTELIDGVRKFDVKDLDIDLIDRVNPFEAAYAILSKSMTEESLRQIAAVISAKKVALSPEEARELAIRAFQFKRERERTPSATSADPWERKMAEGAIAYMRFNAEGRYKKDSA